MKRFRFWASIIFPIVLGSLGYFFGGLLPLPPELSEQSKLVYGLLGVLLGLLTFASVAAWIVRTTTNLVRQLTIKIASEIINQVNQIRPRELNLLHLDPQDQIEELSGIDQAVSKFKPRALILDTSSIIDARILEVANLGFLEGVIIIPKFVLTELQQVADSSDSIKRNRGRKGFKVLDTLKKVKNLKLLIWEKEVLGKDVDDKLVKIGKQLKGKIITCDYNLNKVASFSGVPVLNLNELSNALKTYALPGENFEIKIIQKGKDDHQGVGFLEDGTMVVVERGSNLVGQKVKVEATKIIQNPAGRMIFGRTLSN